MHILFITNSWVCGGAEIYLKEIINAFKKKKIKITLIMPKKKELLELFAEVGVEKSYLNLGRGFHKFRGLSLFNPLNLATLKKLSKKIAEIEKKRKIDLIFVQQDPKEKFFTTLAAEKLKKKIVWVEHGRLHLWQRIFPFNLIYARLAKKSDLIIAVSKAVKKSLISIGVPKNKIKVVWNGIDENRFSPSPKDRRLEKKYHLENKIVISNICRLRKNKGIALLLKAVAKLRNKKMVILLVGRGRDKNFFQKISRQLKIRERVIFAGFHKKTESYYNLGDIFVSSSFDPGEGLPLRILEAMACAKPIIATDISGSKEAVIDKKCGFIIPMQKIEPLAEKIAFLAENEYLRQKMGKEARKIFLRKFTKKKMINKTLEALRALN